MKVIHFDTEAEAGNLHVPEHIRHELHGKIHVVLVLEEEKTAAASEAKETLWDALQKLPRIDLKANPPMKREEIYDRPGIY